MTTVDFRIDASARRLMERLTNLAKPGGLDKQVVRFFDREAKLAAGHITKTMLSGQRLARRTGALARSMTGEGTTHAGRPAMRVGIFRGPALAYAGIQEHGGTIRPVRARALAIPVGPALTPAGVPRKQGPRDWANLTFVPFRTGGKAVGGLFDTASMRNGLRGAVLYYLLVKKVEIPAKRYLHDGVVDYLPRAALHLGAFLADLLRKRSA